MPELSPYLKRLRLTTVELWTLRRRGVIGPMRYDPEPEPETETEAEKKPKTAAEREAWKAEKKEKL